MLWLNTIFSPSLKFLSQRNYFMVNLGKELFITRNNFIWKGCIYISLFLKQYLFCVTKEIQWTTNGDKHATGIQGPGKHEHSMANTSLLLTLSFSTTPALVSLPYSLISHHQLLRANIFTYPNGSLNAFPWN